MGNFLSECGEGRRVSVLRASTAALVFVKFHSHSSRLHSPYHSSPSPAPAHASACCHFGCDTPILSPSHPPASFPLQTTQAGAEVFVQERSHGRRTYAGTAPEGVQGSV